MLLPLASDRDEIIAALLSRFTGFRQIDVVAFVRRLDNFAEMFYRELLSNGNRLAAHSLAEFLVDHGAMLTNLPVLFAPSRSRPNLGSGYA